MGEKSRGAWSIPVCIRPCQNKNKCCVKCFKFSHYKKPKVLPLSSSLKS
jgi:hypothetical protein